MICLTISSSVATCIPPFQLDVSQDNFDLWHVHNEALLFALISGKMSVGEVEAKRATSGICI